MNIQFIVGTAKPLCGSTEGWSWAVRPLLPKASAASGSSETLLKLAKELIQIKRLREVISLLCYIYIIFTNFKPLFMHFDVLFASRWWKHYVILLFVSRRNDWRFEKHMISHLRVCIMVLFFFLKIYLWWCVEIMWCDYYINNPQIKKLKSTHMYWDIYM